MPTQEVFFKRPSRVEIQSHDVWLLDCHLIQTLLNLLHSFPIRFNALFPPISALSLLPSKPTRSSQQSPHPFQARVYLQSFILEPFVHRCLCGLSGKLTVLIRGGVLQGTSPPQLRHPLSQPGRAAPSGRPNWGWWSSPPSWSSSMTRTQWVHISLTVWPVLSVVTMRPVLSEYTSVWPCNAYSVGTHQSYSVTCTLCSDNVTPT